MWYACMGGTTQSDDSNQFMPPVKDNISCGQAKANGVFLDILAPNDLSLLPRIFRYQQEADVVTIHPDEEACKKAKVDISLVQRTIDALGLNCSRLSQARLSVLRPLNQILKNKPNYQQRIRLAARLLGDAQRKNRSSFFTMIRYILKNAAEEHLLSIQYGG